MGQQDEEAIGGSYTESEKPGAVFDSGPDEKHDQIPKVLDKRRWSRFAWIEWANIDPISKDEQRVSHPYSIGLIWFSVNMNVLSFSTGMLAPEFGFGFKYASYTVLGFLIAWGLFPSFFALFGKNLGLRQMVHARYSFGYFGASLVSILNAITGIGYMILNAILAGETLQAVSPNGSMSATVGIVIVTLLGLIVSFCGIRVLNLIDMWFWIPVLISFAIMAREAKSGPQGLHLDPNEQPPSAKSVLSMGCLMAGFYATYSAFSSDVSLYMNRDKSSVWLFVVVMLGLIFSAPLAMMLGAAFATSAVDIPAWNTAIEQNPSPGPLINLILSSHLGNFGKFLTVLIALSAVSNIMTTFYSMGLSVQTAIPILTVLPRFVIPILATAIVLPLAIVGQDHFYNALTNFVSIIAYWAALYIGVTLADFIVIRRCRFSSYDLSIWNDWRSLPPGFAGILSAVLALGLVIPFMDQTWYTGPLGAKVGDLGFEIGLGLSFLLYCFLRPLEMKLWH
ncbi:unnamed protein product [Malassezia sympodialis ATCC 42132]|uniref:Similar to S.cerevisiae protein FCY2 (Purine-cytosine permease) n=1 Tax=Malassezia sympodialis (strain ATCC 42132) TaxID=1230383 RepID=M5EB51_MALS4|nr:uncharacterized protein MSY001_2207 [Malassezia sympodialis ATCC 42132]CCU99501.1 unnamed protein product [Malassezia sympodialis ATCC 42132]SHO78199.1 Similar to S.cerevisiae protein FCY2 (Purine-cytosine permease) [Malassezia sympodialis ATCC 42132]|eukprot:XP_018740745.1 uncharacterized protein MSY001_2207 [Malassezia sympodialis ATCC 42132]